MERIDVSKLLKECPSGMKLDSTMYENVVFDKIIEDDKIFPIRVIRSEDGFRMSLTKYGQYSDIDSAKCIIFPEGKTTWKEFHRPFKDGDIIYVRDEYSDATFNYVAILKQIEKGGKIYSYCFYNYEDDEFGTNDFLYDSYNIRFATKEEKEKLFKKIKEHGYKWDNVTKVLYKIVEPKFKIGDIIKDKFNLKWKVINANGHYYEVSLVLTGTSKFIEIKAQDDYELVQDKFNINTFRPFDKVLMRSSNAREWVATFYSHYSNNKFYGCGMCCDQCIPYEGNEHLLGTTDDCDEYFKNLIS
jgi:hypothetical protein